STRMKVHTRQKSLSAAAGVSSYGSGKCSAVGSITVASNIRRRPSIASKRLKPSSTPSRSSSVIGNFREKPSIGILCGSTVPITADCATRAFLYLLYSVAAVRKPCGGVVCGDGRQGLGNG